MGKSKPSPSDMFYSFKTLQLVLYLSLKSMNVDPKYSFQNGLCIIFSGNESEKLLEVRKKNLTYYSQGTRTKEKHYSTYSATSNDQQFCYARFGHAEKSVLSQIMF